MKRYTLKAVFSFTVVATTAALMCVTPSAEAGCRSGGVMSEVFLPEAVTGMSPDEPGFTVRYWEWNNFLHANSGSAKINLKPTGTGLGVARADWADADVCEEGNTTPRTIMVFESLGVEGGRYALINLADNSRNNVDIDTSQDSLYGVRSAAAEIPRPTIAGIKVGRDTYRVFLKWKYKPYAEALSNLADERGQLLSSITSFSVWVGDGGAKGGIRDGWVRVSDVSGDAVGGFSTDDTAVVNLPRSRYEGKTVRFALGLVFDGGGDPTYRGSGCVCSSYLSAPSAGVRFTGDYDQAYISGITLQGSGHVLSGTISAENEPSRGALYEVYAEQHGYLTSLTRFQATERNPESFSVDVPEWVLSDDSVVIRVELVDKEEGLVSWIEDSRITLAF